VSWIGVDFIDPAVAFEKNVEPAKSVRVLDYACGPGTITHALAGRATEYIGMDFSENMVKAYNLRFNPVSDQCAANPLEDNGDDEKINANAVVGNLLDPAGTPPAFDDPKYKDFDLVVVGMGFHHFSDLPLTTSRLVERLKPGGVFLIVDFLKHAPMDYEKKHVAAHTIAHHGFHENDLKQIFEGAGLTDFGMRTFGEKVIMRGIEPREMLLAKGRKPRGVHGSVL
jgi:SAM-dependent methyltransferase